LTLGRQDLDLLLRAGESGLGGGNARVGLLRIGGSGFKALARRPRLAGELGVARVIGPQTNDLVLQLRKRGDNKIILGGMLANMCVQSHLRELIEQGFEVAVVKDATAGPRHPIWGDGYQKTLSPRNMKARPECGAARRPRS